MRKLMLATLLALAVPTTSQALGLGLRLGYGKPAGDIMKPDPADPTATGKYSDYISSQTTLQLDLMFATSAKTAAGLYLGYAPNTVGGQLKDLCTLVGSCDSKTYRVGLQFTGELLNLGIIGLWGGVGTGYEQANFTIEGGGQKIEAQMRGWEWATLSAGADVKIVPLIDFGLYASYGFGQFHVQSLKVTNPLGSSEQTGGLGSDTATHGLFQIGLRGIFNLYAAG